jgi:hypothetical protein
MRYLPLLFLLFPLFASAQVDLDKISLTSDSTFVKVSSDKDTTYYVFQVKEKKQDGQRLSIGRGQRIQELNGVKHIAQDSKEMTAKELRRWAIEERDWLRADKERSQEIVRKYSILIDELNAFIDKR